MRFNRIDPTWRTIALFCAPLLLTACASMAPPKPPSLKLPKPPADLRAVRKGDRVILTWTVPSVTTDRQKINVVGETRICRSAEAEFTQCGAPVGTAQPSPASAAAQSEKPAAKSSEQKPNHAQKPSNTYTDSIPTQAGSDDPTAFVSYAVEVLNPDGRGAGLSNAVKVSTIHTLPPPQDFSAKVTGQGVVLSWTGSAPANPAPSVHYVYRVFRRPEGEQQTMLVGEVPAENRALTLTDSTFEWQKTYFYRAEAVTVIPRPENTKAEKTTPGKNRSEKVEPQTAELQIEGTDTPELKVLANDVFPPEVPSSLQAVFSGPGQAPFVDLIWAPVADVDLAGYNVYRHEEGSTPVKLNAEPVKTPAYRDANVAAEKNYFYSVSAVDVRGNESARSEETSERVP
jgi:hypothetical protein